MQFTARLLAISAVVSQALALPVLTNSAYTVTEGKAFEITWTNATSPVSLALKSGVSTDLTTYTDIAGELNLRYPRFFHIITLTFHLQLA